MFKPLFYSCLFLASFASAKEIPTTRTWAHTETDLAVDSKPIFGALDNGLRYVIYQNAEPPGRVSLRLHVNAGALNEADDQQGIAHFLEHMLFEGSKNYTAAELIPEMQRLGISFGAHANAYTSFDETVYKLDLPNLNANTIDLGFTVMRDFCDGALLEEKEIEAERGVILSEKNSRDSVDFRLMKKQFEYLTPDFLAANRFPIGTEECIKNCPPDRIRDFYKDFYDPKLMTFVLVGDIDPKVYEQRIKDTFSSLKSPTGAVTIPDRGSITEPTELQISLFTDPEVDEDDISLMRVIPHKSAPDTSARRKENMTMNLAHSMLTKRLDKLAKEEGSPINGGATYKFTWFDAVTYGTFSVTPSEGKWKEAVPVLEQEFRRAMEHGFTQSEFKEASANLLTQAEQAVESFETRTSPSIADAIIPTLNDRKVITTASEDLRVVQELLAELTPADCHAALKAYWDVPGHHLVLTTKQDSGDDKNTLKSLYLESQKTAVTAPVENEVGEFAYQSFGEPSTITSQKHIEDLDTHQLTLSNGIQVNLKKTDFEKGKIYMVARLNPSLMSIPDKAAGWNSYASALINLGGLGEHSNDDLRQILSDKVAGVSFGISEDAYSFSGVTNQEDLETQLQLLGGYLTDPGFRPEADRLYKKALSDQYEQLNQTLEGAMQYMRAYQYGNDPRFAIPTEAEANNFAIESLKEQLTFIGANIEITLVGDLNIDDSVECLEDVLGNEIMSLKANAKPTPALQNPLPKLGATKAFTYSSKIDRAATVINWRTKGLTDNISEARRLSLVAQIISNRMKEQVREKLGSSYSPYAYSDMSDTFENYGNIQAVSICKPEDMAKIAEIILDIGQKLSTEGATQDELDRVQKPAISSIEGTLRKNTYWLSTVLSKSQAQPKRLDWARSRTADYTSVTLDEVNELATKYLKPENAITYQLSPKKP